MKNRITAGELSRKALSDKTKYNAREVGYAMVDDVAKELQIAAHNYREMIGEDEYCVVMVIASDPLICNLKRRKCYCWPYLPSPRPNQSVFLYSKVQDRFLKRLWVLPSDVVMAELASLAIVDKRYQTMQAWSVAFFQGRFWEYIRHEHGIDMLSETEYMSHHRQELMQAGCKLSDRRITEPFDFSKININKIVDTQESLVQ